MSEAKSESSKYNIQINQARGLAIGDDALYIHIEHLHTAPPPRLSASREELLAAIQQVSSELRNYSNEIAGIHLERTEVDQIVEWALNADAKERLGMLLDQPGGGKTVVMQDVLKVLAKSVPTLAIKADNLSGIKNRSDLADRLGLPAPVEECVQHLTTEGLVVVLLDQLDALSLTLSRDQTTLDVMLSTLNRLRDLDNVRIIASCRTFDLNNDPRLSTIKVDKKFKLQPLSEDQVNQVLQILGVDPARLLEGHRSLLTTPLHLDIYARIVTAGEPQNTIESFRTLQELYEALWQKLIEVVPPDDPRPKERIAAVYRLVETMQNHQQTTAPVAVLDDHAEAAIYLERVGFIRRETGNWLFLHQTLYDYCYARRFVAQGHTLSQEILNGPQGLFERSQMVQVLAYLRGANETAYRRELTSLLFSKNLRPHLRLLLIGWFGSLPAPTDDELRIARRLMKDADDQILFLQAASGNLDWFDRLNTNVLPSFLRTGDERLIDIVINYLSTLIQYRPDPILALLHPYLGQSETWDNHIGLCLFRLENWQSKTALDLLCDLLRRDCATRLTRMTFYQLAKSNPAAGCQALRVYLDRRLDDLLAKEEEKQRATPADADTSAPYQTSLPDRFNWDQHLLGEYSIDKLMEQAVQVSPEAVIQQLLPWFIRAAEVLTKPDPRDDHYPYDSLFAWGWYGEHISKGPLFAIRIREALSHLAKSNPANFRSVAEQLAKIETLAVQRVLVEAYHSNPEEYANDIFEYLVSDPRRLNIGEPLESPDYDSCRLFGVVFQYLDEQCRITLEQMILNLQPRWERRNPERRGITQLRFLQYVKPPTLLSSTVQSRLLELERKFPGFKEHQPQGVTMSWVGSPIEQSAQTKMSDEAWLGAMRKYDASTAWGGSREHVFDGGAVELSRAFAEQVKKDPERFYRLALRFDETISLHYITAAISGLADTDAPAEWVFDLVRQFAPRLEGEFRRSVCWALEKRAEAGVPDDLLDLITDWALNDPNPAEELWQVSAGGSGQPYYGGDPHHHGINSNRGAAVNIVCRCALKRKPPQVERALQLLEKAANDPSTAVRTCVIESLGPLLNEDDTRVLSIFAQTLDGHPRLLQSPLVHRFLYWTYHYHFPEIRSFIEALLTDTDDATRQAGARLVCLAAFRYEEAKDLEKQVMTGDAVIRRGAAQVYARNLEHSDLGTICQERLQQLMHDPDEQVRSYVGECFEYLGPEHLDDLRSFIDEFLEPSSLLLGAEHLLNYLVPLAVDEHELALKVTAQILDAVGGEVVDIRTSRAIMERDLVRLPLIVYTHANDPDIKSQAMALFERLLMMGSREAQQALSDWDGRVFPVLAVPVYRKDFSRTEDEAVSIEMTIKTLKRRLKEIVREENLVEWARIITELATAYRKRSWDDRADNIEQGLIYYQQALDVLSREKNPVDWAMVQSNLGTAYRERIEGDRADNIERAITCYQRALEILSQDESLTNWATTTVNLATAYREHLKGSRIENIEQALIYYQQALDVLSREKNPVDWAMVQSNLGTAYRERIEGDRADNIERAIEYYRKASTTLTREENLFEWAEVQAHLAATYHERIRGNRSDNIESAFAHHQLAFEVFTDIWNISEVKNVGYRIYQFCSLFSSLISIPLQSYRGSIADGVYLGIFNLTAAFQDHPLLQFVDKFPILLLTTDNPGDEHLKQIRQALNRHLGPSSRRAVLIPFCNEQAFLATKNLISGAMKEAYAYDIVCLSHNDIEQIVTSSEPHAALRHSFLSQVSLANIPVYNPKGSTPDYMFFGRERELQEICDNIASSDYVLIGGRRIGKTSILKRLERVRLPANGIRALYHECSYTPTQTELVQQLITDKAWFSKPPSHKISSLTEIVQALPDDKPLVILFDEADKLIKPDQQAGYPIFNTLRALSNANRCSFVLCGERALRSELTNPNSPLYNFGKDMLIGRLERYAVEELVTQPMRQLEIDFADETVIVGRVWEFTSGHPSVIQSLCLQLITYLNQRSSRYLTLEDVEAVVADPNFLRKNFLNVYWEQATILERLCSLVMAADDNIHTLIDVQQALASRGIEVTLNQIDDALERLVDLRNILRRTASGYKFAVTAFPQVIAKAHRLDDLIALNRETYQQHGGIEPGIRGGR